MTMSGLEQGSAGMKPTLLLDVDGVINAMPGQRKTRGYTRHSIDGYTIHFHDEVREMADRLRNHFDIAWFTMWNDLAAPLIGPHVGLEDVPFVETSWERGWGVMRNLGHDSDQINRVFYAKTPLLVDALARDQRWVWIDDAHSDWDREYLERQGFDPQNFHLVSCDASVGLTWRDVEQAIDFARVSTGSADATPPPDDTVTSSIGRDARPISHHPGSVPGRASAVAPVSAVTPGTPLEGESVAADDTQAELSDQSDGGDPGAIGSDPGSRPSPIERCPQCGTELVSVTFGFPTPELLAAADRGEVVLGGCCPPSRGGRVLGCPACGLGPMRGPVRAGGTR